jgi:hypothetical protein
MRLVGLSLLPHLVIAMVMVLMLVTMMIVIVVAACPLSIYFLFSGSGSRFRFQLLGRYPVPSGLFLILGSWTPSKLILVEKSGRQRMMQPGPLKRPACWTMSLLVVVPTRGDLRWDQVKRCRPGHFQPVVDL